MPQREQHAARDAEFDSRRGYDFENRLDHHAQDDLDEEPRHHLHVHQRPRQRQYDHEHTRGDPGFLPGQHTRDAFRAAGGFVQDVLRHRDHGVNLIHLFL